MTNKQNTEQGNESKKIQDGKINLDDYAGDEEDNNIARKNANNYVKDIDKAMNKTKESGENPREGG